MLGRALRAAPFGRYKPSGRRPSVSSSTYTSDGDPEATTNQKYVRQGAAGTASGNDWTNAYTTLPATLARDTTYWIADGSYSSYTFDDTLSGTLVIRIKKATASLHGTDTGWDAAYGDGQATFGAVTITRGYYTIDGSTRNESDWFSTSAYGFKVGTGSESVQINFSNGEGALDGCKIRYVWTPGLGPQTYGAGAYAVQLYNGTGSGSFTYNNHLFSRCLITESSNGWFLRSAHNCTVEYCASDNMWSNDLGGGNHGEVWNFYFGGSQNHIVRFNKVTRAFLDGTNKAWGTAIIAIADGSDGHEIYGNTFYDCNCADGAMGFTGNAGSPGDASNCKVYNNTFAKFTGSSSIQFPTGSSNDITNNLWVTAAGAGITSPSSTIRTNTTAGAQSLFTNYGTGDLHLANATITSTSLGSPYDTDMDGVARSVSIGAYEKV